MSPEILDRRLHAYRLELADNTLHRAGLKAALRVAGRRRRKLIEQIRRLNKLKGTT